MDHMCEEIRNFSEEMEMLEKKTKSEWLKCKMLSEMKNSLEKLNNWVTKDQFTQSQNKRKYPNWNIKEEKKKGRSVNICRTIASSHYSNQSSFMRKEKRGNGRNTWWNTGWQFCKI